MTQSSRDVSGKVCEEKGAGLRRKVTVPLSAVIAFTIALIGANVPGVSVAAAAQDDASPEAALPEPIWLDAYRNGEPFGYHEVTFSRGEDGALIANTRVRFRVKAGPIPVYRYELNGTGVWRDGELTRFNSGGRKGREAVDASIRVEDGRVFVNEEPTDLEPPVFPVTHWNKAAVRQDRLIDAENGDIVDITVRSMGSRELSIDGRSVKGEAFDVDGEIDYTILFQGERWVGLRFTNEDDEIIFVPGTAREDILFDAFTG